MSKPFDATLEWWHDELAALAQIVHQGHTEQRGTWRTCYIESCARFRAVIEESTNTPPTPAVPDAEALGRIVYDHVLSWCREGVIQYLTPWEESPKDRQDRMCDLGLAVLAVAAAVGGAPAVAGETVRLRECERVARDYAESHYTVAGMTFGWHDDRKEAAQNAFLDFFAATLTAATGAGTDGSEK